MSLNEDMQSLNKDIQSLNETPSGHRNANRNPKWNHETTVLWLFSKFQVKRDLGQ